MRRIKRYANGRFYDTMEKRYITRDAIIQLADEGENVAIVETRTGDDITGRILSGEGGSGPDPGETIENLLAWFFKRGEDVFTEARSFWESVRRNFSEMPQDELDQLLAALKNPKIPEREDPSSSAEEIERHLESIYERLCVTVDRRIDAALKRLNLAGRDEILDLGARMEALIDRMDAMESGGPGKKVKKSKKPAVRKVDKG